MFMPAPTGGDFTPTPPGTHKAICYRVIDLGTQQTVFQGQSKLQHKILLSWELPDELMEDGRPFTISKKYTFSSHEKAVLRHDLESWRGARFKDEEIQKFDISKLIGVGCFLSVVQQEKDGRTYSNIASVSKLPKGTQVGRPVNEPIYFNLYTPDWRAFDKLSDGLKQVIQKSPEYVDAMRLNDEPDEPPPHVDGQYPDLDDEIPF
jgi:hypothetical protein